MNVVDYVFLAVCGAALALLLIGSKVLRAIFWESLRHPFRASRIEVRDGAVVITRSQPLSEQNTQPRSPAGAH